MASMSNCETIANNLANKLGTSIKTKSAGTDTGMAYATGTYNNSLTYAVLDIDEGKRCNIEISDSDVTTTVNLPSTWSNSSLANRAANAYNGSKSTS